MYINNSELMFACDYLVPKACHLSDMHGFANCSKLINFLKQFFENFSDLWLFLGYDFILLYSWLITYKRASNKSIPTVLIQSLRNELWNEWIRNSYYSFRQFVTLCFDLLVNFGNHILLSTKLKLWQYFHKNLCKVSLKNKNVNSKVQNREKQPHF